MVSFYTALEDDFFGYLDQEEITWLKGRIKKIQTPLSARNLYLTYSLIGRKIPSKLISVSEIKSLSKSEGPEIEHIDLRDLSRIYILSVCLTEDPAYFIPKVSKLIQVADTRELVTLLRYLVLLPHRDEFRDTAVEALRTNISTVFEAISLDNPYPRLYFDDQQWNQMYLKAAFMQLDLSRIQGVEERANASLARIISDYAHERWAASRDIDPLFWRPVSGFLDETLLEDMKRLLSSTDRKERMAGFLSCLKSENPKANSLIKSHPLFKEYLENSFDWNHIKTK